MIRIALVVTAFAALALGCTTRPSAVVQGYEAGPGAWRSAISSEVGSTSEAIYIGASADGKIVVKKDGRYEVWSR